MSIDLNSIRHDAKTALQAGQFEQAVKVLNVLLQYVSTDAAAYSMLGIALAQLNRRQEALDAFQKAVQFSPSNSRNHFNLAAHLAYLGNRNDAIKEVQEALRLEPGHTGAAALLNQLQSSFPPKGANDSAVCSKCGASISSTDKLCWQCGAVTGSLPSQQRSKDNVPTSFKDPMFNDTNSPYGQSMYASQGQSLYGQKTSQLQGRNLNNISMALALFGLCCGCFPLNMIGIGFAYQGFAQGDRSYGTTLMIVNTLLSIVIAFISYYARSYLQGLGFPV